MTESREEAGFDGSEPVREQPPEVPGAGRSVVRAVAVVVGALVVLAALLWLLVPFG